MDLCDDFGQYEQSEEDAADEELNKFWKQVEEEDKRKKEEEERKHKDQEREEKRKKQLLQEEERIQKECEQRAKADQEESKRKKEEEEKKQSYNGSCNEINHYGEKLTNSAYEWELSLEEVNTCKERHSAHQERNKTLSNTGTLKSIIYCTTLSTILIVIGINYFLINAPVSFMASLVFGDFYDWRVQVATVILPIGLMGIEIYISDQLYLEKWKLNSTISRNRDKIKDLKGRKGNAVNVKSKLSPKLKRWQITGYVLILFTPLMILGTTMVRENWWEPDNILIHLGLMALAAVTDASIIFGGDLITPSKAFLWFKLKELFLLRSLRSAKSKYRLAERNIEKYYNLYCQSLVSHQKLYPNDTDRKWHFSDDVISIVNQCLLRK